MENLKTPFRLVVEKIDETNKDQVPVIYKAVFAGHPWHEDLICRNSLQGKCSMQYTRQSCDRYDVNRKTNATSNDCRNDYQSRLDQKAKEGIILLPHDGLETCVGCGEKLELIQFYPDFCNHFDIVNEAVEKEGYIGYLLKNDDELIGFSWGYKTPMKRTKSVAFPEVNKLLAENGIDPEKAFYAAESGLLDKYQGLGLVWPSGMQRILDAKNEGYKYMITRTINPAVHGYFRNSFSGREGRSLFKDPERGSQWFAWDFDDFNAVKVKQKIDSVVQAIGSGGSWTQSIH